jgi:pimeloyl-ACP methyl ester carboxylesterase
MTIILLHGALGSKKQMEPIHNLLNDFFETTSINFSGHGGNPIPALEFSLEMFMNDVLKEIERLQVKKVNILGYSLGGYVGLNLALKYPQKINKLVTLSTKLKWDRDFAEKEAQKILPEFIEKNHPKLADKLKATHHPEDWRVICKKTSDFFLDLGKNHLSEDELAQINHQVLLSTGDRDEIATFPETYHIYKRMNNSQLLVMPNTGHQIEKMDYYSLFHDFKRFFEF